MATALQHFPRGPVTMIGKTEVFDRQEGYDKAMLSWRESARDEANQVLRLHPEYDLIATYIAYLEGRQWDPGRPRYRSTYYDNRLADARIDSQSMLTDIRPSIDVTTAVSDFVAQSQIVANVIKHEWRRMSLDRRLVQVVDHALLDTGYWKIGAMTPGRMSITAHGVDSVLPIQPGAHIQESTGVLYRTYKPLQYFKRNWGRLAEGLEKEVAITPYIISSNEYSRPGSMNEYTWNSLSPAMRHHLGIRAPRKQPSEGGSAFPVVELEEYWIEDPSFNESSKDVRVANPLLPLEAHNYHYLVPPGERLFPRKRLIVFAGDKVLYDGPSPYWHGMFPFAELSLDPTVWAPGGISKYRHLMPLQRALNEIGAGTLDVIKKALRPVVIRRENAIRDAAWEKFFPDLPGGKLTMTPMGNPTTDLRFMDPPSLPQYVAQFLQYVSMEFDRRSGKLDIGRLTGKKQVPGGDTIEQMRDAMQPQFRLESRYVEQFLIDAGVQAVANVFQYYTAQQRMRYLGPDGVTMHDFDYHPDNMVPYTSNPWEFVKLFAFEVVQGSLHGASHDRQKMLALTLYKLHAISRKELLRRLEWSAETDKIEAELKEEMAQMPQMPAGRTPRSSGQKRGQAF